MLILTDQIDNQAQVLKEIVFYLTHPDQKTSMHFATKLTSMMASESFYVITGGSSRLGEFNLEIYWSSDNYERGEIDMIGGLVHDSVNGTWDIHT